MSPTGWPYYDAWGPREGPHAGPQRLHPAGVRHKPHGLHEEGAGGQAIRPYGNGQETLEGLSPGRPVSPMKGEPDER